MISFDACLSFNITERQQGETVGKRLNCFMGVVMFAFNDDHISSKLLFDEMCSCTTAWPLYTPNNSLQATSYPPLLASLLSNSSRLRRCCLSEVPLRFQLTNELTFIFKATVQMCQALPSFPKGRE